MKKTGKLLTVMILILATVTMMAGCGAKKDAGTAFDAMMQVIQTGDIERIGEYYDFGADDSFLENKTAQSMTAAVTEILKKTQYRVESAEKLDASNVKITARVTTLDLSQVMNRYINEIMTMVAGDEYQAKVSTMTQEEYQKLLTDKMLEILNREDIGTTESTISVTMVKSDGKWIPGGDKDEFFGTLFGDLTKAVQSLI